jgi:hypothetical protein
MCKNIMWKSFHLEKGALQIHGEGMEAECFAESSPFRQQPKEEAFASFSLTSHRRAVKVLLSRDKREREKEREIFIGKA